MRQKCRRLTAVCAIDANRQSTAVAENRIAGFPDRKPAQTQYRPRFMVPLLVGFPLLLLICGVEGRFSVALPRNSMNINASARPAETPVKAFKLKNGAAGLLCGAGLATTPQESSRTMSVGQRKRSFRRQLTI